MDFINRSINKYLKLFIRLGKKFSPELGLLLMIRSYLTNNIYYYIFGVVFRSLFLIMLSGNYMNSFLHINGQRIQDSSKLLSLHYIYKDLTLYYNHYIKICLALYLLFLIRLSLISYILIKLSFYKKSRIFQTPFSYQIIIDHLIFLFFPYLLEFLAIPYYIYFGKNKLIKEPEEIDASSIIIIMIINFFLIIFYNFQNFIYILCANKNYTYSDSKAVLRTQNDSVFENSFISFRYTKLSIICFTLLQNVPLIQNIEEYLDDSSIKYYKVAISIILVILIIMLIREKFYLYNYMNLINNLVATFIIFCFYSIILDIIFYLSKFEFKNWLSEVIYIIEKFLLSYITYLFIIYYSNKYQKKQIINILFEENSRAKKNNNIFTNAILYLNQIMVQIKEKNEHNQKLLLINFLTLHIKKCNKPDCNCKLISDIVFKEDKNSNLLLILNYLYESCFIESDYYNNYDLTILLSEHYCHLVNNPTMAFSFIISLLIRKKNKLSYINKIVLYELCEKYIYSILDKILNDEVKINNIDEFLTINKEKLEYFQNYFIMLKSSYYSKILMNKYINNMIKILKYKSIFEDTLIINYDEDNENIKKVKINFFDLNSNIKSGLNDTKFRKKKKLNEKIGNNNSENIPNIYKVIQLVKKEKFYNQKIIDIIKGIDTFKNIPIFIIYKYYLFFDLLKNGEIPKEISSKLNLVLFKYRTLYNNTISDEVYLFLNKLYINQNSRQDSKFFIIFEFKKEITTKYFDEYLSLKLGFEQKNIINEKMDELMPREFSNSHQNMVKKLFIGEQKRVMKTSKNYVFDESHTILFSIDSYGIMIYSLSNYLIMLLEVKLINDSNYTFMLNHNFDLIANTKNFINDYLLNQKIFTKYKLSLLEMIKIKPEKIIKKLLDDCKSLEEQKEFREIKTDEYFIPQLYVPLGKKNIGMMDIKNYNTRKNKLLIKISELNNNIKKQVNAGSILEEEQERLLKNERNKEEIIEDLLNNKEYIIKKNFSFNLNKMKFIENIAKELTKILDNELTTDNNQEQNLVINSKRLISNLLLRKELLNASLNIEVIMMYIYDRPFYFINIDDTNKFILNLNVQIPTSKKIYHIKSLNSNYICKVNNKIQNTNSNNKIKAKNYEKSDLNNSFTLFNESRKKAAVSLEVKKTTEGNESSEQNTKDVLEKIDNYRIKINQARFIFIIKLILYIIITGILIIYILTMILQRNSINMIEKILLTCYFNAETKNIILNIYSKLIGHLQDMAHLTNKVASSNYIGSIISYASDLREYYHFFQKYYIEYNLEMKDSFPIIYQKNKFLKLRGKWRESLYDSEYCSELDFVIHYLCLIEFDNITDIEKDIDIFLFYQNRTDRNEKISSSFIKLTFYFSVNYENIYKKIYENINSEIYSSYTYYSNKSTLTNYAFEITSILLYSIFFISCYLYLYYSNLIIIKNILFLFLDFSQAQEEKNLNSNYNYYVNIIMNKLVKFQKLLNDFNLSNVKMYFDFLNKKNNNNDITERNENSIEIKSKESQMDINSIQKDDIKTQKTNNSSQNILLGTNSSLSIKKLNQESKKKKIKENNDPNLTSKLLSYKKLLKTPSIHKSGIIKLKKERSINKISNNTSFMNNDLKTNFIEAILNKSNIIIIYIIKIHFVIITFFIILIIVYSIHKIRNNSIFITQYERFYSDFSIIEERYSYLYYYFNTLKTLIVFNYNEERWTKMKLILEKMNSKYETMTNNYNHLLSKNMKFYNEVNKLFEIFTYNKKDSAEYLKNNLCKNETSCKNYIISKDSIFDSGIDFGYKSCFSFINNVFMDYLSIKNKTSAQEIINTITDDRLYEFKKVKQSTANVFYFLKEKIFNDFRIEAIAFGSRYKTDVLRLNIISLVISILILLFVNIFIFINVSNFTEPIKDSVHRINLSFFFIKNYKNI